MRVCVGFGLGEGEGGGHFQAFQILLSHQWLRRFGGGGGSNGF